MQKQIKRAAAMVIAGLGLAGIIIAIPASRNAEQKSVIEETDTTLVAGAITEWQTIEIETETNNEVEITSTEVEVEELAAEEYLIGYTTTGVRVRQEPDLESEILDTYIINTEISYITFNDEWVKIIYNDTIAYIYANYVSDEKVEVVQKETPKNNDNYDYNYDEGDVLTPVKGVNYGPSGRETYYNMDMSFIVDRLHRKGYEGEYWVREDGCKMFGDYILIAANFDIRPIGTLLQTSLGMGIVADTGGFVKRHPYGIDIAVTW